MRVSSDLEHVRALSGGISGLGGISGGMSGLSGLEMSGLSGLSPAQNAQLDADIERVLLGEDSDEELEAALRARFW